MSQKNGDTFLRVLIAIGIVGYLYFIYMSINQKNLLSFGLFQFKTDSTIIQNTSPARKNERPDEDYRFKTEFDDRGNPKSLNTLIQESDNLYKKVSDKQSPMQAQFDTINDEYNKLDSKLESIKELVQRQESNKKAKILAAIMLNFLIGLPSLFLEISSKETNRKSAKILTAGLIFGNTLLGFL